MSITFYNHRYWKITETIIVSKDNHYNAQHCHTCSLKVKPLWCVIREVAVVCVCYAAITRWPPTFHTTFTEKKTSSWIRRNTVMLPSKSYSIMNLTFTPHRTFFWMRRARMLPFIWMLFWVWFIWSYYLLSASVSECAIV